MREKIIILAVCIIGAGTMPGTRARADDPAPAAPPAAAPLRVEPDVSQIPVDPEILNKLIIAINADPDDGAPPLKVKFTVDLYDDDISKPKYIWSFGDGGVSREPSPSHTFKKPGWYKVTLRVEDALDRVGEDETTITVEKQ